MEDTLWIAEPAPLHWLHPSHKRDCFGLPGFSFNCQWSSVTHRLLYIAYQFCNISAQVFSPTTYHSIVKCHFSHITHHSLYITLCDISVQVECAPLCQIGWYRNGTYLKNHTGVYSIQTRVKTQIQHKYKYMYKNKYKYKYKYKCKYNLPKEPHRSLLDSGKTEQN